MRAIWQQRPGQHFCVERNHSRVSVLNLKDEPALVMICIVCTLISHLSTFFCLVKMNLRPDLCVTLCIFLRFHLLFLLLLLHSYESWPVRPPPLHYQFLFPLVLSLSLCVPAFINVCFVLRYLTGWWGV